MKTITLTDNQYKLLISTLSDYEEELAGCSCNDIYKNELKPYSTEELNEMLEAEGGKKYVKEMVKEYKECSKDTNIGTWGANLKNGFGLFNTSPVRWLIKSIKNSTVTNNSK